jgi:hypothetical protein
MKPGGLSSMITLPGGSAGKRNGSKYVSATSVSQLPGNPGGEKSRRPLQRSVGELWRRAEVSAAITRRLRRLRAHGLLRKVSGTHRDVVTAGERKVITALLAARQADVEPLTPLAA